MSYFFGLEYIPRAWFENSIIDDGIKIIVPKQMPAIFHNLHTEKSLEFIGTNLNDDIKKLKKTYKNYDIFCLEIGMYQEHTYPEYDIEYSEFEIYSADIKSTGSNVIAFVCIPNNNQEYKEKPQEYINNIETNLTNYFYGSVMWRISVLEPEDDGETAYFVEEDHDLVHGCKFDEFDLEDKKWFEKCKKKYNIGQEQINKVKQIIQSHNKYDEQILYDTFEKYN